MANTVAKYSSADVFCPNCSTSVSITLANFQVVNGNRVIECPTCKQLIHVADPVYHAFNGSTASTINVDNEPKVEEAFSFS